MQPLFLKKDSRERPIILIQPLKSFNLKHINPSEEDKEVDKQLFDGIEVNIIGPEQLKINKKDGGRYKDMENFENLS